MKASVVDRMVTASQRGQVLEICKEGFVVGCGQDALLITQVHLEASKPVSAYDFIHGHRVSVGEILE